MADYQAGMAYMAGAFLASLLVAFLLSRLGLYLRRSSRFEPATVAGVHVICFFILGAVACSSRESPPGSSAFTVFVAQIVILVLDLLRLPRLEDYSDDVPQKLRPLSGGRLAAVGGSALLGFFLVFVLARPATDREMIDEVERNLAEAPGGAPAIVAFRRDFPKDYETLVTDIVQRRRALRSHGEDSVAAEEQLGRWMNLQIAAFAQAHVADMAKAPTPALNGYARSMKEQALALQKLSRVACGSLAYPLFGAETEIRFQPEVYHIFAKMLAGKLDLARAGIDHPTQRPPAPPQAVLQKLRDEMRRREALERAAHGAPPMPSAPSCLLAVRYYSAIAELPPETSAILTAYDLGPPASRGSASATSRLPRD